MISKPYGSFYKAADEGSTLPNVLAGILITVGVIAAVALLLGTAFKSVTTIYT